MNYEEKKQRLIKEFLAKKNVRLGKTTSNLFRYRKQNNQTINVRDFNNVISINTENLTAHVEGMTTYEELVKQTLKHNLLPTVVPQLKSITIGGALTGIGIESSSFKYGLVHETITQIEVLLATGEVITATADNEHSDLFFAFPNSYATLGYALKVTVKLIPALKYVKLTHYRFSDQEQYFKQLGKFCKQKEVYDFIDGVIFSENKLYITCAQFTNESHYLSNYTNMNIFYKSIRNRKEDYLTTLDYIWRWDTDWFWCSKHFGVQNKFIRTIWPKKHLNSIAYWKIKNWNAKHEFAQKLQKLLGKLAQESVVQDVEIPFDNCSEFTTFFHQNIGIKPIWICPIQTFNPNVTYDLYPMNKETLYINFGFWDVVNAKSETGYHNKIIEKKVKELNGKKSLYSDSFYSQEQFWQLYNKEVYTKLKAKYDPQRKFKTLYQKCVLKE
jgi:FAD/FMN-containing dehydrogenase